MAQLNVRDRRLEARIAYVGPELSGKATNLTRLSGGVVSGDDVLAIDWTSASLGASSDYEVTVKLVALRGAPSKEGVATVLQDVDGVVFVADAHPSAHDRNRASLAIVRDVLAGGAAPSVPVVVQVNKADLPDALPAEQVAEALDVVTWPRVSASALRGEGVIETLERALSTVLDALRSSPEAGVAPASVAPPPSRGPSRPEGNPLLAALRQVLRDTASEHVAQIEERTNANLERLLTGFSDGVAARAAQEGRDAVVALQRAIVDDGAQLRAAVSALDARTSDVLRELATARTARAELPRVLEARAKAEREQFAITTAALEKAVASSTERIAALAAGLDQALGAIRALEPRLAKTEATLQRDVREVRDRVAQGTSTVEGGLELLRTEASDALAKVDGAATAAHALVHELIEELRKPKKGWFG